ncbi:hypothetical protein CHU98_g7780 [Xylaria longipes]|nr:hypothetical protein CHU98_g7780 [Xylaria longipes]
MPTTVHERVVSKFNEKFGKWKGDLENSNDPRISQVAGAVGLYGSADIDLFVPDEPKDRRSPDGGILHDCELMCPDPALVFEVGLTNTRKESTAKATQYNCA